MTDEKEKAEQEFYDSLFEYQKCCAKNIKLVLYDRSRKRAALFLQAVMEGRYYRNHHNHAAHLMADKVYEKWDIYLKVCKPEIPLVNLPAKAYSLCVSIVGQMLKKRNSGK